MTHVSYGMQYVRACRCNSDSAFAFYQISTHLSFEFIEAQDPNCSDLSLSLYIYIYIYILSKLPPPQSQQPEAKQT